MAEAKTKPTNASVTEFLNAIADEQVRSDCKTISKLLQDVTKAKPQMWGRAIIGFGRKDIHYAGGRVAEWPLMGFSPRKANIVLYINGGLKPHEALLKSLGTHKTGGGCLYLKRLSDVHMPTLTKLLKASVKA